MLASSVKTCKNVSSESAKAPFALSVDIGWIGRIFLLKCCELAVLHRLANQEVMVIWTERSVIRA